MVGVISALGEIIEISPKVLLLFGGLILAIATVIRIGSFIKGAFFKKSTNQFWTTLTFRKWLAFSMDLIVIASIAQTILGERWMYGSSFISLVIICIGIRIALHFAMKGEQKK